MSEDIISRLKRPPFRPQETWQGAFVRLPRWVTGEGPQPYRPLGSVWVSVTTGMAHTGEA